MNDTVYCIMEYYIDILHYSMEYHNVLYNTIRSIIIYCTIKSGVSQWTVQYSIEVYTNTVESKDNDYNTFKP